MSDVYVNIVSISNLFDKNGVSTFINGLNKSKESFKEHGVIINKTFTPKNSKVYSRNLLDKYKNKVVLNESRYKKLYIYKLLQFLYFYIYQALIISFRLLGYYSINKFHKKEIYFFNDIFVCYFSIKLLPKRMKSVIIFHSSEDPLRDFFMLFPAFKKSYIGTIMRHILRDVMEESNAIVTLSEDYAVKLKSNYPNKIVKCIYNTSFISSEGTDIVNNIMESPIEYINLLSVGSLQYRKGFDLLISALASLPQETKNIYKLKIAGDGEQRSYLENLISKYKLDNNVFLLGNVDDISDLLNECHIFCLPSREEGLPIALIEALSFNKPIVCTSVGSLPEIFKNNDCFYIENDVEDISRVLNFVSNHLEILSELSNRSKILFHNLFSNQAFVKSYSTLFIEISN